MNLQLLLYNDLRRFLDLRRLRSQEEALDQRSTE